MAVTMDGQRFAQAVKATDLLRVVGLLPLAAVASGLVLPVSAQQVHLATADRSAPTQAPALMTEDPSLRVLLFEGASLVLSAASGPLLLRDAAGLVLAEVSPGQELRVAPDPLSSTGMRWQLGEGTPLAVAATELWLEPEAPEAVVLLQQRQYRGQLQLRRQPAALQAINHVSLETYLPSVVGSEMPASWPLQALSAQAVAARTYALRQRRPGEPFDLRATVSSQVYRGLDSETAATRQAVATTRGQVLTYDGRLIDAVFHSSSGGSTEASGDLWPQQLPYLVAVQDFDEESPARSWQERFEPLQLQRLFAEIGGVTDVAVLARTSSGRLRQVRLKGPGGVLQLSGAELRQRLGLRSTWVEIDVVRPVDAAIQPPLGSEPATLAGVPPLPEPPGPLQVQPQPLGVTLVIRGRGFGHGIGMSQWGAYGLARRGASYSAILSHYYPGTQLDAFRGP